MPLKSAMEISSPFPCVPVREKKLMVDMDAVANIFVLTGDFSIVLAIIIQYCVENKLGRIEYKLMCQRTREHQTSLVSES